MVYLGDVNIERGAGVAVDGVNLQDWKLVFVGRVTEGLKTRLLDKATDPSKLEFAGLVPNPEAI